MRYDYEIDVSNPKSSHRIIASLIGKGSKVLDVGCSSGFLAKFLHDKKGCYVVGVEKNSIYYESAKLNCDYFIDGNIENNELKDSLDEDFDVVVLGDVLEHLVDPWNVLKDLKKYLNSNGFLLVSIPNIAYWRIRRDILIGKFRYTDEGILDRTHLRFFDLFSAKEMIENSGYKITYFDVTCFRMPKYLCRWFPSLLAYQFVFKASTV
ncbi:MAG: methyltransferase domain-containing protein [Bacteroidetes bacterium]|nr:methyltransferase domain-containing protein [Bacteroidota bacterium]